MGHRCPCLEVEVIRLYSNFERCAREAALGDRSIAYDSAAMLLERKDLLDTLRTRLEAAGGGEGSLVLLAGEAGVGKTSLVHAFVEQLDARVLVISGACDPLTTPRPLGPLYDFTDQPGSGLDNLELDQGERTHAFAELVDRLGHSVRPIVMVIEDVHWADEGTLDFLRYVGRRVEATKAMVVCTYRDDEVAATHPLRPVLGQLIPLSSTSRMVMKPLSLDAVRQIVGEGSLDADDVHDRTGGNPFFVTEIMASGDFLPASVQDAVLARVAMLGSDARRVVDAVSIGPRGLLVERATTLSGVGHSAVDEAMSAGVLVAKGSRLSFRHELARAAVEQALAAGTRSQLHHAMLALLSEVDHADPATLAHHAHAAGDSELTARWAPVAGDEAVARGAGREAVAFYRTALEHRRWLEPEVEAHVENELGWQLEFQMDHVGSQRSLERAVELFRELGDVDSMCRAMVRLQTPVWKNEGQADAWAVTDAALVEARRLGRSDALAFVQYRIAHNNMVARNRDPACSAAIDALTTAQDVGNDEAEWRAGLMLGCVDIVTGDASAGVEMVRDHLRRAERQGRHELRSMALGMLGTGSGEVRRYDVAEDALRQAIALTAEIDDDVGVAYNTAWLARVRFEQGAWSDATELAEEALRTDSAHDIGAITAQSVLGRVRVRRGDPGGPHALDLVLGTADEQLFQYVWSAYCGLAEDAWLRRDAESAVALLSHAYDRALETDSEWARGEVGFWMWRLGAIESAPDGAAEVFARQIEGDWSGAAAMWEQIGCPYEVGLALLDGNAAARMRAVEIFDDLGAAPVARLGRQRLRDAGVESVPRGPNRTTRANAAGLTGRQFEVLGLMAKGLSNKEIADQLFVSPKTVEHHASAIYAKLDVDGRNRAVAVALERDLLA